MNLQYLLMMDYVELKTFEEYGVEALEHIGLQENCFVSYYNGGNKRFISR